MEKKYKLIRESDLLIKESNEIAWITFKKNGGFKNKYDKPAIKRHLILDPQRMNFTWLTTNIIEIMEQTESVVRFKTKNSTYILHINEP